MRRRALPAVLCLLLCACAAIGPRESPPGPAPAVIPEGVPEAEGGAVHTDWSKLGEREKPPEPVGARWYETYTGELIPREDYGPLVPYAGLRLMDDWPADSGCLYGLMTREGVAVTDPVYSSVRSPGGYGEEGAFTLPLLLLSQGNKTADEDAWDPVVFAVAAMDGSWCTPFCYQAVSTGSQGLMLFCPDSITVMSASGEILKVWAIEDTEIPQGEFESMLTELSWGEGWSGQRRGNYMALGWDPESDYTRIRCFDLDSGGLRVFGQEEWDSLVRYPEWEEESPAVPNAQRLTDRLLGPGAPGLLALTDYGETDQTVTYYREDGTPLPELTQRGFRWYRQVGIAGGLIEVLDLNTAAYYDLETLEQVFLVYLNYEGD